MLLIGAGLMIRSLANWAVSILHWIRHNVVTMTISVKPSKFATPLQESAFLTERCDVFAHRFG